MVCLSVVCFSQHWVVHNVYNNNPNSNPNPNTWRGHAVYPWWWKQLLRFHNFWSKLESLHFRFSHLKLRAVHDTRHIVEKWDCLPSLGRLASLCSLDEGVQCFSSSMARSCSEAMMIKTSTISQFLIEVGEFRFQIFTLGITLMLVSSVWLLENSLSTQMTWLRQKQLPQITW